MADRPILFSAPMVRALLSGAKTQTRRVVKRPANIDSLEASPNYPGEWVPWVDGDPVESIFCPYGVPGDRLWVREAWAVKRHEPCMDHERDYQELSGPVVRYLADGAEVRHQGDRATGRGIYRGVVEKGRPSIHMPRWASRIRLEITGVRVERLNDCSPEDAKAEGLEWVAPTYGIGGIASTWNADPIAAYRALWERINGADSWAANPWVWVVEFKRVEAVHG